jgi:hypothetical protein
MPHTITDDFADGLRSSAFYTITNDFADGLQAVSIYRQFTITDKFTDGRYEFQRAGIKCISDYVQLPTKLPTDFRNMEGN